MKNLRTTISISVLLALLLNAVFPVAPVVAATTTNCQLSGTGFYGQFYNMSNTDDGMNASVNRSIDPDQSRQSDWFSPINFVFNRTDARLNFGSNFYPIQGNAKAGDPFNFSVRWRAAMNVPTSGTYTFTLYNDDDAWVFIDGSAAVQQTGSTPMGPRTSRQSVSLTAGRHEIEVLYVERAPSGAMFSLTNDGNLTFIPLPPGCSATGSGIGTGTGTGTATGTGTGNGICNCPCTTTPGTGTGGQTSGRVLGSSSARYTPAIALYKTETSPAIYAIFANGERHYISSPAAFELYGYSYNRVKVVSQATLDRYPEARLLRTPENPTIYHLFSRPNSQWLKIPIPTPTVFVSYPKNEWGNVVVVDALDLAYYPNADLVRATGSSEVYLIQDGKRRLFSSTDVFQGLGYNTAEIVEISRVHLDAFPPGDPIG